MCLRARALAAARPGDGRVGLGGRAAVLTGAARRGAASCGSLLIAAVPSSPIESDGFPTSSFCGARRGRRRAGGVLRVGIFAVFVLLGWFLGGAASDGCFRRSHAHTRGFELSVTLLRPGLIRNIQRRSYHSHSSRLAGRLSSNSACSAPQNEPRRAGGQLDTSTAHNFLWR